MHIDERVSSRGRWPIIKPASRCALSRCDSRTTAEGSQWTAPQSMGSTGAKALVADQDARASGQWFAVTNGAPQINRLLSLTGLNAYPPWCTNPTTDSNPAPSQGSYRAEGRALRQRLAYRLRRKLIATHTQRSSRALQLVRESHWLSRPAHREGARRSAKARQCSAKPVGAGLPARRLRASRAAFPILPCGTPC